MLVPPLGWGRRRGRPSPDTPARPSLRKDHLNRELRFTNIPSRSWRKKMTSQCFLRRGRNQHHHFQKNRSSNFFFQIFPPLNFFFKIQNFRHRLDFRAKIQNFKFHSEFFFFSFKISAKKSNFWKDFYRNKKLKLFFFVANCDRNFKNTFLRKKILSQKKTSPSFSPTCGFPQEVAQLKKKFWVKTINSNPVWEEHLSRLMRPSS